MYGEKAVYGVVKPWGDEYVVVFAIHDDTTRHEIHGYGEFPHERYPDIPVISFEGNLNGSLEFIRAEIYCIETATAGQFVKMTLATLEEYLKYAEGYGAVIIRPGTKKLQVYIEGKWMFVFCRNKGIRVPITTLDRDKAIPAHQHSLGYFTRFFPNLTFRYSN